MLNWLHGKIERAALATQAREFDDFLARLEGMNLQERACVLVLATEIRLRWALHFPLLLDPVQQYARDPDSAILIGRFVREAQAKGALAPAAAMMVWLFTIRAGARLELRNRGRRLWALLAAARENLPEALDAVNSVHALDVGVEDAWPIPIDMEPVAVRDPLAGR